MAIKPLRSIDGEAAFNCFIDVVKQLFKCLALRGASGNGRHLSPVTTFFCFMHDDFDFHGLNHTASAEKQARI